MSKSTAWKLWAAAIIFDVVSVVVMLCFFTYGIFNHETGFYDEGRSIERDLFYLWILWGLIPGFCLTVGALLLWQGASDDD